MLYYASIFTMWSHCYFGALSLDFRVSLNPETRLCSKWDIVLGRNLEAGNCEMMQVII